MEIHSTPASFSFFVCLLISSELLLPAHTLTLRDGFTSWAVVINYLGSIFEVLNADSSFRWICGLLCCDNLSQPVTGRTCRWRVCAARKPDPFCGLISGRWWLLSGVVRNPMDWTHYSEVFLCCLLCIHEKTKFCVKCHNLGFSLILFKKKVLSASAHPTSLRAWCLVPLSLSKARAWVDPVCSSGSTVPAGTSAAIGSAAPGLWGTQCRSTESCHHEEEDYFFVSLG